MDLLTIGDTAIDIYMQVDDKEVVATDTIGGGSEICFVHGSKIPVSHFETSPAGNSLNVGIGCSLLGLTVGIYTELGDDQNADRIIEELKTRKVETKFCRKNKGTPTNVHTVIVSGGERTIFSYHEKRAYSVLGWPEPKWLYYTSLGYGFETFQKELVDYLHKHNKIGVAFNPGTIQMKQGLNSMRNIIEITDILFLNKDEAIKLTGEPGSSLSELHEALHELGAKMTVVTDGRNGSSASDGAELVEIGIYSDDRPITDKTGAGDSFASGFLSAIFYGKSMKEALSWGAINSGNNVKVIGAANGLCTKEEIEKIKFS
jgi:sugar/nucleoside kinase (ribokinase family)